MCSADFYARDMTMVAVIDEVPSDIKKQMAHDLGVSIYREPSQRDILNWFHYRARLIPMRFREVVMSEEVKAAVVRYPAISEIENNLATAGDLRPWLSQTIRNRKLDPRADMLFNDWQITHFHLKKSRSDDLLFAFITARIAVLAAIRPHLGKKHVWVDQSLLEAVFNTHALIMENVELQGISPPREPLTVEDRARARDCHYNVPVQIKERLFVPGGGLAGSGCAVRMVAFSDKFFSSYKQVKKQIENNHLADNRIGVCLGCELTFDGRVQLFDKYRGHVLWQSRPLE